MLSFRPLLFVCCSSDYYALVFCPSDYCHLHTPFRLLRTCCCRFDRYLLQPVAIFQSIFSLRFSIMLWFDLEKTVFVSCPDFYAWYHLCCVHWSARYRKSNLAFSRAFWQFLRLSGSDFCLRYSLREYIVLRYIANEWKMANSRTIGSSFSFERGIFPKFSAR